MSKRADELKDAIARRAMERTASPEEVAPEEIDEVVNFEEILAPVEPVVEDPEYLDEYDIDEEGLDGELEDLSLFEAQIALAQESGFEAYLQGYTMENNPFVGEMEEDSLIEAEELGLLAEGWESGWFDAHREAWTAEVILSAKHLVECADGDEAAVLLGRLEQGVGILSDLMDMSSYEEFWGFDEKQ